MLVDMYNNKITTYKKNARRGYQPEGHSVETGESHVSGAHIKGNQIIAEGAIHDWHDPKKDHHRAVQGEHLVVGLTADEIGDWTDQFRANNPS